MSKENFESQKYRDELAQEIKSTPSEGRKEILKKSKESPAYWQARTEKIKERQDEQEVDNGLAVLIKKKTIYHGSGVAGIEKFDKAEEDTIGSGIYFTSEAKDAIGYARRRSKKSKDGVPTIYESLIENMKLLDLRKSENVSKILKDFKPLLVEELKKPDLKWFWKNSLEEIISHIDNSSFKGLKDVTQKTGEMFSGYVKSLGYEGLVAFEGGEGDDVGDHDTYLIFDQGKLKINQEHNINIE